MPIMPSQTFLREFLLHFQQIMSPASHTPLPYPTSSGQLSGLLKGVQTAHQCVGEDLQRSLLDLILANPLDAASIMKELCLDILSQVNWGRIFIVFHMFGLIFHSLNNHQLNEAAMESFNTFYEILMCVIEPWVDQNGGWANLSKVPALPQSQSKSLLFGICGMSLIAILFIGWRFF